VQEFDNQNNEIENAEARAELEAALRVLKEGEVVTGTVVRVNDDYVMVDVGYKSEGTINLNEITHRPLQNAHDSGLKPGDTVKVMVYALDPHGEGGLRLSIRRAGEAEAWEKIVQKFEAGEVIEAQVTEAVKGGLVVDLGLRAFLPASQVERGYVNDLSKYVGQTIRVKIIELEKGKNRVILSRRQVLETERESSKKGFWDHVEEGQVREGTVKSLTDFGAFIDLGGVDGLLHISEMSYGRIKHPSQVLKEGEKLTVKVLRLDREKEKVSLGLKQVLPDPWETVMERYAEGTIVTGTVARLATFGAFVELEPGVDGLVHISQLADHRVNTPGDVVQVGQAIKAKVVGVNPEQRRISLSLREVDEPAAEPAAEPTATAETEQGPSESEA
jgi:4-hydroxy-3-methylbut-2-enyl diphosphate reductase